MSANTPGLFEEVPVNWQVRRLRTVLRKVAERNRTDLPLLSVVREKGVILRDLTDQNENHNYIPDDLSHYKVVREGQFAINKMKAWQGSYGVSQWDGIVSPAYHVYAIEGVTGHYFHYAIRSRAYVSRFSAASDGVRVGQWDLSAHRMREIPFLIPTCPEQTAIVRFLEHAGHRIKRYMRAKVRLIELLEEQKQAIIHQAVTGQIDVRTGQPYPTYEDSGIDWLGKVPEHWEVRRLRSLATIGTGVRDTINRNADGLYPFFVRSQTVERIDTWSFDGEAVLTAGDGAGVGKVFHYVNGKFDFHQRVYKFSDFSHILGHFFFHYFRCTLRKEALQGTAKSTVDSLRLPMLQNFPVALPPLPEQALIVEYLDRSATIHDAAITGARRQIDLLREYRTRLIADVVTGKLDVREAAGSLSEVDPMGSGDARRVPGASTALAQEAHEHALRPAHQ